MAENRHLIAIARRSRLIDLPDGRKAEMLELLLTDWAAIQEEAAQWFKRDLIKTYTANVDLLPKDLRDKAILGAFERAEKITPDTIETSKVEAWLEGSLHGRLFAVWRGLRQTWPGGLTYDEAAIIWQHRNGTAAGEALDEAAIAVREISQVTVGNGQPPAEKAKPPGVLEAAA